MDILKHLNQMALMEIAAILATAWLAAAIVQRLLPWLAEKFSGRQRLYLLASVPVLRLLIIVSAGVLIVTRIVEPTLENLIALLGALGLALGFAFKDYASSLVAGIVTLYEMPYRLGDWVEIEGAYGEVKAIGLRAVEILTPDDTLVTIPHLKLWTGPVYNGNDGSQNLLCVADFYLHPHHDAAAAKARLQDVALTSAYLQIQRPIQVIIHEKPWGTHYRLKAYPVDPRDQFRFITDLTVRGKAALAELGVEFAVSPVMPTQSTKI